MRNINFYITEDGKSPVAEFLDSLSNKQAQKVAWVLQLVEELDAEPSTYLKQLMDTDNIWEVRIQVSGNIFRLLGFFDGDNLVVLNHDFQKKTQKSAISRIENHSDDVKLSTLERFATALGKKLEIRLV
ncbi:type II toxin-antitoxin system RelE/ParE family toxin [Marinomonas sp. IMCC 4694]|uniref:type II toxin-antitoxin system RelE/ParE family toxin n=1 Tax=Marinomonas sp. IMCC 4694 TaxID=2605432 RepID=UPI0011E6600A|nr:type II toxin-antitoxin system RelE/ParE family toxin [Marinomonas sp. IMCC 4694]TYL48783.1 type II toxin-antitoxin system RelE/ParE family toxin [Marinomonas sp. IMCC 4694]